MKDTFYFSHDYHSRSDEKILRMRAKYGSKGYGIFWMLVEIMAESSLPHVQLRDIPALAVSINEDQEWLKEFIDFCIDEAGLFICDGEEFTSMRMIRHKTMREKFKIKGQEGAAKRWPKDSPPISPPISEANAKERKEKERKGKEISKLQQTDQDFLNSLKTNAAYFGIDIDQELGKMDAWISARPGKIRSRRFIVNWLNRAEKPVNTPHRINLTKQQQSNLQQLEAIDYDKRSI